MLYLYRKCLRNIIALDLIFAFFAWQITNVLRHYFLLGTLSLPNNFFADKIALTESFFLPIAWVALYYFIGDYAQLFIKNKFTEFTSLVKSSINGCLVIFFILIINDVQNPYIEFSYYYVALGSFYLIHLLCMFIGRIFFINLVKKEFASKQHTFSVLVISDKENPLDFLINPFQSKSINLNGYHIEGVLSIKKNFDTKKYTGNFNILSKTIEVNKVQIVIVNLKNKESDILSKCINLLAHLRVEFKIVPDIIDILTGNVKSNNILGLDLIDIHLGLMPEWEYRLKRILDICISATALVCLFPFFIYIIIRVRMSSKGSIFFKQERIGYKKIPFNIYKFRSMYIGAERNNQAQLAQDNDNRITNWGKRMRKWRIDELPQFWNVFKGDMSLIGPRPERAHFIKCLEEKGVPFTSLILRIKPGLSSLGMVRYGYASNIDQMKERIKYDLLYIENLSVLLDFKIIIATFRVLAKGYGK